MKRYRCPRCGNVFKNKTDHCPNCNVELHYRGEEETKKVVVETSSEKKPTFDYQNSNIIVAPIEDDKSDSHILTNGKDERKQSHYDGHTIPKTLIMLGGVLFSICTVFIGVPWAVCWYYKYEVNHTYISGHKLMFDGKGSQLLGRYLLWLLLTILTLGIFSFFLANRILAWKSKHIVLTDEIK